MKNLHTYSVVEHEREFWQERYLNQQKNGSILVTSDRLYEREHYLFSYLRSSINGKRIFEFGCGNAATLATLFPPSKYSYEYTGLDIAPAGLKLAKKLIPRGKFYCRDINDFPLKKNCYDVILSLGVVHHIENDKKNLKRLFDSLTPHGLMIFSEPLHRDGWLGNLFRKAFFWLEESEHEERLHEKQFLETIGKYASIIRLNKVGSPFYTFFAIFFGKQIIKWPWLMNVFYPIDSLIIQSLGRVIPVFGGGTLLLVAKKR